MLTPRRFTSRYVTGLLILAVAGFALQARAARRQTAPPALAQGETIKGEMAGGETRLFHITMSAGQYSRVVVEQLGIDVVVALIGPGQKRLLEFDSPNGNYGPEPVSAVAEESGEYTIEVRSPDKKAAAGSFEVRVEALREPTPLDLSRVNAERAFTEVWRQFGQGDAKSRQQTLEKLEALLPVFRSLEDRPMEVSTLNRLGLATNFLGQPQKALGFYEQALTISRAGGDSRNEARLLNNIGGAYDILGEPQRALDCYFRALSLWETPGNDTVRGDTLNNIGVIYFNLGELQSSLDYYTRALTLWQAGSDQRREANTLDNIGLTYIFLGEPQQALEYLGQALELRRAIKDVQGEANSLTQMGLAYTALSASAKALDYYHQALPLRRAAGDRRGEAVTLKNIGIVYASLGQPEKAVGQYEEALKILRAISSRREEALTLLFLGQAYALSGDTQKGVDYYSQALSIFQALNDRLGEAKTRQSLAEAESARGNFDRALGQVAAAVSIIEVMRARVLSQQLRASFFAARQDIYEFEIDLLMRMHRLDSSKRYDITALEVSEHKRARGLIEMLSESGVDIRQGVDTALLGREREISQRLSAKAARLIVLLGQQNRQEQAAALKREVDTLEAEHQQVLGDIRRQSPHYATITQPQPLGMREIQQLLDPDTLLLEYSLGPERSYLWAVTRDGLQSFQLPGRVHVEQAARRLYELVTARSLRNRGESARQRQERVSRADVQMRGAADELGRMLLGPLSSELKNKRLIVVADGALQYIPFAMLPVPSGVPPGSNDYQPLIVEHEIVSLPSASTLAVQRRELVGRKLAPNNIALIADPVFDADDERLVSKAKRLRAPTPERFEDLAATRTLEHLTVPAANAKDGLRIPRLPYTRLEAEQILAAAPNAANLKALNFKASLATALGAELHKYRYVHFATHGYIDSERPALSALVLSLFDERGEPQNGLLKAQEIYNLNLPAELVVLSACQTGLGKEIKGEGMVGLTRGLMYAGAARVVVSLWNVSDKGTADLMSRLYRGMLRDGLRPTAALRAAQLELWKQKQWRSPYYWAAFVQQGEWR